MSQRLSAACLWRLSLALIERKRMKTFRKGILSLQTYKKETTRPLDVLPLLMQTLGRPTSFMHKIAHTQPPLFFLEHSTRRGFFHREKVLKTHLETQFEIPPSQPIRLDSEIEKKIKSTVTAENSSNQCVDCRPHISPLDLLFQRLEASISSR